MNNSSYKYEIIKNENGMFDNYIDLIYIIITDIKYKDHVINQINKYNPHKKIVIQYLLNKNDVSLNDAYYNIFLNSLKNNYKNIIVLEDDFTFDYNINQLVVDDIGNFIKNNNYHIYHLGSLFHISVPSISMHLKSFYLTSSHGVIYNRDYVYYYIKKYELGLTKAFDKIWLDFNVLKYTYIKPLCFKKINAENKIFGKFIELFNLDKYHNPGYKIFNIISLIISFHLIYLFLNHRFFLNEF